MASIPKLRIADLTGRVAIVTGGSRGIGRECCLALARAKCNVVVAAKSTEEQPTLPGTIWSVAEEIRSLGVQSLALKLDLRDTDQIESVVDQVVKKFGRLDILINNASALWWQDIADTPIKKYDLITSINSRGTFAITKACLPHMKKNGWGRVICMSPPIRLNGFAGRTAYNISKFGMTMVALGVAAEYQGTGITGNTVWPATIVESLASKNFKLGDEGTWRKPSILADSVLSIISEPDTFTGNSLIDDIYLRSKGLTDEDLKTYRCDPNVEPLRVLDPDNELSSSFIKRGDVKKLNTDINGSKL
jgi:NAD(P)-dependent dehydrogenase (short-subunit alcohol dehydrogenase family)